MLAKDVLIGRPIESEGGHDNETDNTTRGIAKIEKVTCDHAPNVR
jgi:hypothetical protein